MRDYFTFSGTDSTAYGCVIEKRPEYIAPKKIIEKFSVRGRSGDLTIDTGAYENVTLPYNVFVPHEQVSAFVNWLKTVVGYQRLETTYEPDVFRMALYEDELTVDNIMGQFGQATIEFNAKPQRFLKSGEVPLTFTESGEALLNEYEAALPMIVVNGSGDVTFAINNNAVNIVGLENTITIDCETKNCYRGTLNLNNTVSLTNQFPFLDKGANTLSWTGNVTSVEITPRWWKI